MLFRLLREFWSGKRALRDTFTEVYRRNLWRGADSRSGKGSGVAQTEAIRREIPALLRTLGVSTMVDAPCGDFHWMSEVDLAGVRYIGVDIVKPMIEENERRYGSTDRYFVCADLTRDALPRADLILCRDCLVHLNFQRALAALANFKRSGAAYLLTTTFPAQSANPELDAALGWRPLNLALPPFDFPAPLQLIGEAHTGDGDRFRDKSLGLWRLDEIS